MTNSLQKLTVVRKEESQSVSKKEIVDKIISVLANNDLSISEAREILRVVSHKLGEQKITTSF